MTSKAHKKRNPENDNLAKTSDKTSRPTKAQKRGTSPVEWETPRIKFRIGRESEWRPIRKKRE